MTVERGERRVAYLDHAATTSIRPGALEAFNRCAAGLGNPSSLHAPGRHSRRVVEESRESIAAEIGVRPNDVVFTSGGTEADNLAIKGLFWSAVAADPSRTTLVISSIDHHAVLDAVQWLVEHEGADVAWIPALTSGTVDVEWLAAFMAEHSSHVALCSVMWANNETGVVQPIDAIAQLCDEFDVPLHCDGVQAVAWLAPSSAWRARKSSLAISAHKFGGPVGVGALVLNGVTPQPLLHGGGQEIDVRSGTVATALIASAAAALQEASSERTAQSQRLGDLWTQLHLGIQRIAPDAVFVGDPSQRLASIGSVSFPGCQADGLLMLLDAESIACSAGSACTAGVPRPSHVLLAMGVPPEQARSTLRFSLGWNSDSADVEALLGALPAVLERASGSRSRVASTSVPGAP